MSYGDSHHTAADRAPLVGRPRGAAWRALQADGVVWEGQVYLVGDADLATRMIVTHRRVAFARGGAVALDLARDWLRPAPILRRDGTILLSITPPGTGYAVEPETIALRMRDGHPAAGHVIAMLAGSGARRMTPEAVPSSGYVRGLLPPLPDGRRSASVRIPTAEPDLPPFPMLSPRVEDDLDFGSFDVPKPRPHLPPLSDAPKFPAFEREAVVRLAAPPTSLTRDRTWNLEPMREIAPRRARQRRRGWIFRLGGLVVLIGVASLFATDRVPLRTAPQSGTTGVASTATVRPVAQFIALTAAAGLPLTVVAESTAVALGVGGETAESSAIPTPAAIPALQPTESTEPTAAPAGESPARTEPAVDDSASQAAAVAETAAREPTAEDEIPTTDEPGGEAAPATAAETAPTNPLRLTIDLARRGATLPEFGLAGTDDGDWIAVLLTVGNASDAAASVSLADFSLRDATGGTAFAADKRSTVVASILRLDGAPDALDSVVTLDPGETIELALVFQVPGGATDLVLMSGETTVQLAPDVATAGQLTMSRGFAAETPDAIEATVLGHILGEED